MAKKPARRSTSARPRSAGPKISSADIDKAVECLGTTYAKCGAKMAAGWKRSGSFFQRKVAKLMYSRFLRSGGAAGDWPAFLQWLLENLPAIIQAIMAIFAHAS